MALTLGFSSPTPRTMTKQANIETSRAGRNRQQQVAGGDQCSAEHDGTLCADQAVGNPTAGQRRQVNAGVVQAIDRRGSLVIEAEAARRHRGDQEENENRPHAIEGESFPHLGEEQRGQPARVPEKRCGSNLSSGFALSLLRCLFLACRYFFFE